jgi:hypothetical protein
MNEDNALEKIVAKGLLDKHLSVMAEVYAVNKKFMMGEGLFRESIE